MTTFVYVEDHLVDPSLGFFLADDDVLYIGESADLYALVGPAVSSFVGSSGINVQVRGSVVGASEGIALGYDGGRAADNVVGVASTGFVFGAKTGILLESHDSQILNDGEVSGGVLGIQLTGQGSGRSTISNTGVVRGGVYGIEGGTATEAIVLTNHGLVAGGEVAFQGGTGNDIILNDGTLDGLVILFDGNDRLDSRGGTVNGDVYGEAGNDAFDLRGARVGGDLFGGDGNDAFDLRGASLPGAVDGDAGNDTFRPGAGDEAIDGGAGVDTIDFKGAPGLRVSLADGSGTGAAEGDSYRSIENVSGSRGGNDEIVGSAAANTLLGFGGADSLEGGAGNDRLVGGAGHDGLAGQGGNDTFVLNPSTADFDTIGDFSNAVGDDDVFEVSASAFGGALPTGVLAASRFQVRADNLAQDADDRFIFRTTDQTLWFDSNGVGAGGLSQIADLQAGATMTAADILVVA